MTETADRSLTSAAAVNPDLRVSERADRPSAKDVHDLLHAFPPTVLRFLTVEENAVEYATLAYLLYWHQTFGKSEVGHDELREQAYPILESLGIDLGEARYQQLLDQLYEWRVVDRAYSARGIKSVHEWRRHPYYYWATKDAVRLIEALRQSQAQAAAHAIGSVGRDFLRLLTARLAKVVQDLDRGQPGPPEAHQAYRDLRHAHLVEQQQFRAFLANLNSHLIEFGRSVNIEQEQLERVSQWLQSYVGDMLTFFRESSRAILSSVRSLERHHLSVLADGYETDLRQESNPFQAPTATTHPTPRTLLHAFNSFYQPAGGLEDQASHIRNSTSATIRRLEEHFRRLAETTYLTHLLNLRIREIIDADLGDPGNQQRVRDWLGWLIAPRTTPYAAGIGSPERQGRPPWPRKRRASARPPILDSPVEEHQGTRTGARIIAEETVTRINAFIDEHVLCGRDEATLAGLPLEDFSAFRTLLEAVKDSKLVLDDPKAKRFTFTVHDPRNQPADLLSIVRWVTPKGTYAGPLLTFRRIAKKTALEVQA